MAKDGLRRLPRGERGCLRPRARGERGTGRRSVVVRITAKRHRPIFLPPQSPCEASTCFPSVLRISVLQFARCGSLTRFSLLLSPRLFHIFYHLFRFSPSFSSAFSFSFDWNNFTRTERRETIEEFLLG